MRVQDDNTPKFWDDSHVDPDWDDEAQFIAAMRQMVRNSPVGDVPRLYDPDYMQAGD